MTKQQVVSKGFTLIELMIVVTIIGILASISLSNFSKYKNNAKVAESYQLLSAILKSQGEYFITNLRYRSLEPNPTTITTGSASLIEQDASWTAMGAPLPSGEKSYFGYIAYAGYLDQSGTEYVVNSDGSVAAAGGYSFGGHANSGSDTCPSTTDTSDIGLNMNASTDWLVILATADLADGSGAGTCSIIFQTIETQGGSTSTSPFVKVNIGE